MPKTVLDGAEMRISRRTLRRIGREANPQRVEKVLSELDAKANGAWPAAFGVEYGLMRGDGDLTERCLERCLAGFQALGARPPRRYWALLVASRIESGRAGEAMKTLSRWGRGGEGEDACDREIDLLSASACVDDETRWLAFVNAFFAAYGLPPLTLTARAGASKFSRLSARGEPTSGGSAAAKVTVIVSCFNAEDYLETSLRSLSEQSHADLEIIAIDDMSSDRTWDLLNALARREPRLKLLRNAKNVGTYVSRNRALRVSTGDYVTTQDSDDWSHPERIRRQLALLENDANAIASYCAGVRMWGEGRFEVHPRTGNVVRKLCYPSLMYRKTAIIGLTGYWDCVRVEADAEYFRRVLQLCGPASVVGCPEPLMIQLRRQNSLTTLPQTVNVHGLQFGDRMTYREAAARFARRLHAGNARYDFEDWSRPFPAPPAIVVPDELVREAARWD